MYNDTSHTVSVLRPSIRHVKGYKIINLSGPSPWRSLIGVSNLPDKFHFQQKAIIPFYKNVSKKTR